MKRIGYIAAQRIKSLKGQHIAWNTEDDDKNVRLNSRSYTATSGESTAVQSKPRASVGGTIAIIAFEAGPGFNDGIGGSHLVGFKSDCYLKGSSGTLTGEVRAFQGQVTDENVAGRTFGGDVVVGLWAWHQLAAHTFNGHVVALKTQNAGGGKGWDAWAKFEGDQGGIWHKDPTTEPTNAAGYIKVLFGTTARYIQLYSGAPVD